MGQNQAHKGPCDERAKATEAFSFAVVGLVAVVLYLCVDGAVVRAWSLVHGSMNLKRRAPK
jgi:hypothetical protein